EHLVGAWGGPMQQFDQAAGDLQIDDIGLGRGNDALEDDLGAENVLVEGKGRLEVPDDDAEVVEFVNHAGFSLVRIVGWGREGVQGERSMRRPSAADR